MLTILSNFHLIFNQTKALRFQDLCKSFDIHKS